MKKLIAFLFCMFILLFSAQPIHADAAVHTERQVEYLEDGSYFVTVITEQQREISLMSTTVTRSKTSTYHGKDGKKYWSVKVTGTFTYNGKSAACTKSTISTSIYDSHWKFTAKSASYSKNQAIAKATVKEYLENQWAQTINKTVTLTCSPTGIFS